MPRLTDDVYYERYRFLHVVWQRYPNAFAILTSKAQWEVHDFYQPSKELTKEQLLAHRRQISRERPSLPARAGKHFDVLNDYFRSDRELPKTRPSLDQGESIQGAGNRHIRVRALVRPEIDLEKLASAFIDLAEDQAKRKETPREP